MSSKSASPRTKGFTAAELTLKMSQIIDDLDSGDVAPEKVDRQIAAANSTLRTELGRIEYSRLHGKKNTIVFFEDGQQ